MSGRRAIHPVVVHTHEVGGAAGDEWTVDRIRSVVLRLAAGLADADPEAAAHLQTSADAGSSGAERLLILRSALITTRSAWEAIDEADVVADARQALAAGKRLAISMDE